MSTFDVAYAAHQAGRVDEAERGYREVLRHEPRHADALHLLGLILYARGSVVEAEALYRFALQISESPVYWVNLSNLLDSQARLDEACHASRSAIQLSPGYAPAHCTLGNALRGLHRLDEAIGCFQRALELQPSLPGAALNLGGTLYDSGRTAEAEQVYLRTIGSHPEYKHAWYNLGLLYIRASRAEEAVEPLRRATELAPERVDWLNDLGTALRFTGRVAEAESVYRVALERSPELGKVHWNLAQSLFARGAYREAWPHAEYRHSGKPESKASEEAEWKGSLPEWQGESLEGRSILLCPEQGYGDFIQFVRFASSLKALGAARITFVCPEPLAPLLQTADGVDEVISHTSQLKPHDYWKYAQSVPLYLNTTVESIPAQIPYLHALPERVARWQPRLPKSGLRVGLVWKGSPHHEFDSSRSLPGLNTLAPLWHVSGVSFVSLQKGEGEDEPFEPGAPAPLVTVARDINDFADTAAAVESLDLIITVDTSVAHVAGALGKQCWVMLATPWTDWRWINDRTDSPWYPGVLTLFRQQRPGDWDEVVGRVAVALQSKVEALEHEHVKSH